jgi:hypothetical protein
MYKNTNTKYMLQIHERVDGTTHQVLESQNRSTAVSTKQF